MYTTCHKCIYDKTYRYFKNMQFLKCQLNLNKAALKVFNWWKEGQKGDEPTRGQRELAKINGKRQTE